MFGSRTIKVLGALLAAMTVGSLTLMLLEPQPLQGTASQQLAAVSADDEQTALAAALRATDVPLRARRWESIVVHAEPAAARDLERTCHFLLDMTARGPRLRRTPLWNAQRSGGHVRIAGEEFDDSSIGICLKGEFAASAPPAELLRALANLTRQLQRDCQIPAEKVYLYRQLDYRTSSPGRGFPERRFDEALIR